MRRSMLDTVRAADVQDEIHATHLQGLYLSQGLAHKAVQRRGVAAEGYRQIAAHRPCKANIALEYNTLLDTQSVPPALKGQFFWCSATAPGCASRLWMW